MGTLGSLAIQFGRPASVLVATLWAGVFMTILNPLVLIYDVGFQLSMAATLGIVLLFPYFKKWLRIDNEHAFFKEAIGLTLSAQVAVLPLLIFHFGGVSLVAPLANVLLAWLIPFGMIGSFIAVFASYIPII